MDEPGSKAPDAATEAAIRRVLHLHSRGLDRCDAPQIKACYWPEATVDYGSYKGDAHTFAELVVPALTAQYELTSHRLSNTLIDLYGLFAHSESHVSAGHLCLGGEEELLFNGRYLDRLEQRQGQWRLIHRQVVMDWSRRHPLTDERTSEAFAALSKGAHAPSDPLYPFLGAN